MVARYSNKQKAFILKALTDPKFRAALKRDPVAAIGGKMTAEKKKEIALILAAVKGIDSQIAALADELLCANGGPCGIG